MAWLHAAPKRHDKDNKPPARIAQYEQGDYRRRMPPVIGAEYLVQHWNDCGLFVSGMSGQEVLPWHEIKAYSEQGGYLDSWEAKQIRQMSQAYVSFKHKANNISCIAPYRAEMTEEDKLMQAQEFKASMSKLKNM